MASKAKNFAEIGRQIFGNLPLGNGPTGNRVLKRALKGDTVASYFNKPMHLVVPKGDEYNKILNEDRLLKIDRMKRRGKGAPKKGAGKRASKKK